MALLACPFCRELFELGEAKACPVCGVPLTKLEKLPLSHDALHDEGGVPLAPELEPLPWTYFGRGRGLLTLTALAGLAFFFLPWVHLTMPDDVFKSGFTMAHERIGWAFATLAAWVVLIPTVLSRRTIAHLRGARVAAMFLSAIPAITALILLMKPPRGGIIPVRYTWEWPIYATVAASALGIALAIRLGGSISDIKVNRGSSEGQVLH